MRNEKPVSWKIQLFFASGLPLAFLLEFVLQLLLGRAGKGAAWDALKQLNLFLLLFYLGLWYTAATGRLLKRDRRQSKITSLNLKDKEF